jgi:GMP reductase
MKYIINRDSSGPRELDFSDVLISPQFGPDNDIINSRKDVGLIVNRFNKTDTCQWSGVPIIAANMTKIGTFEVAEILQKFRMLTALHKFYSVNDYINQKIGDKIDPEHLMVSCGSSIDDVERCSDILDWFGSEIKFICLDVANGYTPRFREAMGILRDRYPTHIIVAGNVAVLESRPFPVTNLEAVDIMKNCDYLKVGIGSGSVCTTRIMSGVGYPQFSLIEETTRYASVVSDGGCVYPGDIAKAFGIGASFVMIGGLLANHIETGSEYYGMSSTHARKTHFQEMTDYRASEGRYIQFEKEPERHLEETITEILGGLRSALTYTGHATLDDFIEGDLAFRLVNRTHNTMFG